MSPAACWLAERAGTHAADLALVEGAREMSYGELAAEAARRACRLAGHGVARGSVVALPGRASLDAVCWVHAVLWLGAAVAPINPDLPAASVRAVLRSLRPDFVLTSGRDLVCRPADHPDLVVLDAEVLENGPRESDGPIRFEAEPIRAADRLSVLASSGSTGAAKIIELTVANHRASAEAVAERLALSSRDQWLLCLPLHHIGGLAILVRAVISGASVVLHRRFDSDRVRADLAARPLTIASLVPTMLTRLLDDADGPLDSSLRAVLVGGAPAPPELLERARQCRLPVLPTYGMTEACSQLATLRPQDAATVDFHAHPRLVGPPLAGVEVRIAGNRSEPSTASGDEPGADHPPDGPGCEVLVRGAMISDALCTTGDPHDRGWYATGDFGHVDALGRLHVLGRLDRLIISGGINVDPTGVESALLRSGLVGQAVVIGIPDRYWGRQVAAVVTAPAEPGGQATARARPPEHHRQALQNRRIEAIEKWCRANLAPAMRPRRILLIERIPRTDTGKPRYPEIEALLARCPAPDQ